jgi:hypothetical protein
MDYLFHNSHLNYPPTLFCGHIPPIAAESSFRPVSTSYRLDDFHQTRQSFSDRRSGIRG